MEFEIKSFVNRIREVMYENFPFEDEEINRIKHKKRLGHIRDFAFKNNPTAFPMENLATFDIGGEYAETVYPYYHILQDSQVIHIKGKGTKSSKGSQDKVKVLSERDYGRISWNGKSFTKEYSKNVRGSRSKYDSARRVIDMGDKKIFINKNANYYPNKHYKYIDRILDATLPYIASEFGLRAMRKKDTGLQEEYNMQQQLDIENVLDILNSFTEE